MSKKVRTAVVQFVPQSKATVEVVIDRPKDGDTDTKNWHYLGTNAVPVTGPEGVDRVALVSMYQMRVPPPEAAMVPSDDEVEEDED
jgi:hypothetical protein